MSRAAVLYAERNPKADFIRKSGESEGKSFERMVDTFLLWRDQIDHPDPEQAIRLAFLVVASMLRDLVIFDRMRSAAARSWLDVSTAEVYHALQPASACRGLIADGGAQAGEAHTSPPRLSRGR